MSLGVSEFFTEFEMKNEKKRKRDFDEIIFVI